MSNHLVPHRFVPGVPVGAFGRAQSAARAAAFWVAVALPFAYVPAVLLAPAAAVDPGVLTGAVASNLFALLVGHGHEP